MSVTLVFASASKTLIPKLLDRMEAIAAGTELLVVCEFPPPRGRWIPYRFDRTLLNNYQRVRAVVGGRRIAFASVVLEPHTPYAKIRALALLFAPTRTLFFNENLDHFMLRPRSLPALLGHFRWRLRSAIHWQLHPGGTLYTWAWRLRHPRELRRPWYSLVAPLVGRILTTQKRMAAKAPIPGPLADARGSATSSVSVVIPSRNGRDLLQNLLPLLERELHDIPSEVIVVDNGSDDGTAAILAARYPWVRVEISDAPLSFARAVNRGIQTARFSRVCLLNNDMEPHAGFFAPLLSAFDQVPELFCATAQIYFPEGKRREETGKAVFRWPLPAGSTDFPVHCVEPIPGENLTYVLYGSGGCSVYDTTKLKALGGIGEIYEPAYVEDLDAGFRAWQRGWPTVFVAAAVATHQHRATTSRYYREDELDCVLEVNFLRFLTRAVVSPDLFFKLWSYAVQRLTVRAAVERHVPSLLALSKTPGALGWTEPVLEPAIPEEIILSLGNGEIAVFPGNAPLRSERVIIASCYQPFPLSHGGAVRMYNLMRRAASEYAQILITFVDELQTPPSELLDICVEVIQVRRLGSHMRPDRGLPDAVEDFDSPTFRGALRQTVRKWRPSIVQLEFTQMAQYAADAAPAKTILVEHDITIDLYEQLVAHSPEFDTAEQLERWRAFETQSWKQVDRVVVMSNKDRRMVGDYSLTVVARNGVDLERFQPSGGEEEPGRILFIGSFAHLPNLLALDFFLAEIWPKLQQLSPVLHVIGGSRHEFHYERQKDRLRFSLDAEGVEFEGFVADVRPAYHRAAVVIAPLLASAGTNIKILEAMAIGKAIVSTPAGVNGLEVDGGVLIESDADGFASTIASLLGDPARREAIGGSARRTVEQTYSWDTIAREQSRMYRQLIRS